MTAKSRATLNSDITTNAPDNTSGAITAAILRAFLADLADSALLEAVLTTRGDIMVRGATIGQRLALGSTGSLIGTDGTDAIWRTPANAFADIKQAATTSATGVVELATAAEYRTGTDTGRVPAIDQIWAAALAATLTDGANIAVDLAAGFNFGGSTTAKLNLAGNRTLSAPSNVKGGQAGVLWFGATTSTRTLTLNAAWNLLTGIEAGPYSITTAQTLGIAYVTLGTTVYVTAILRIG